MGKEYHSKKLKCGGVVNTSNKVASKIGAKVLKDGGNAMDAAYAVQYALNVVEPQDAGIGGGCFIMLYDAKTGETRAIDGRETAPASIGPNSFESLSGPQAFSSGLAVGVPGTPKAFQLLNNTYGSKPFQELIEPAICLAEKGYTVDAGLSADNNNPEAFSGRLTTDIYQETRDIFRPGGVALKEGDLLVNKDLAKTFKLIQQYGVDVLYKDDIAPGVDIPQAIIDAVNQSVTFSTEENCFGEPATEYTTVAGNMSKQDFLDYEAKFRDPINIPYRDHVLKIMPAPTSGGLTVGQILGMLSRFPLGDEASGFGYGKSNTLNAYVIATALAFADRSKWIGDPDFNPLNQRLLLDEDYVNSRADLIPCTENAGVYDCSTPGAPVYDPGLPPFDYSQLPDECPVQKNSVLLTTQLNKKEISIPKGSREPRHTTHFSIIDKYGNVVSVTTTIEQVWGTGITVPGYGFLLNNELTDFNSTPQCDLGNGGNNPGANDALGGKRPRSSMSPSILFNNKGVPISAYGAPGGPTIIESVAQTTINLLDNKFSPQASADLPRILGFLYNDFAILTEPGINNPVFDEGVSELAGIYPEKFVGEDCIPAGWIVGVYKDKCSWVGNTDCQRWCQTAWSQLKKCDKCGYCIRTIDCKNTSGVRNNCTVPLSNCKCK